MANHISDRGLISRICKELYNSTNKSSPNFKIGEKTWIDISLKKIYKYSISTSFPLGQLLDQKLKLISIDK